MSADHPDRTDAEDTSARDRRDEPRVPGVGDDERENREHIAATGEPRRDELGNADGAS